MSAAMQMFGSVARIDYREYPLLTHTLNGRIVICARCGKRGAERPNGQIFHVVFIADNETCIVSKLCTAKR